MTYDSRIPVSKQTQERIKAQKRGGETYDELLRQMVEQYEPKKAKD
jgi:glucan phosphoethanolaminetransferase (alkaline phosphatase superfamily)